MFGDAAVFGSFAVKDVDASAAFYRDVLGLSVREQNGMLGIALPSGGEILVYPKPDHEPANFTVLNISVPDVYQAAADLRAAGVELEQYDTPGYATDEQGVADGSAEGMPKVAWFRDPSGNIVSVLS